MKFQRQKKPYLQLESVVATWLQERKLLWYNCLDKYPSQNKRTTDYNRWHKAPPTQWLELEWYGVRWVTALQNVWQSTLWKNQESLQNRFLLVAQGNPSE